MDTETAVNNAQAQGTFDVLAFVEQTAYPEQSVVVFQDVKSADLYSAKVAKRFELEKLGDLATPAELDEIAEYTTDIEALGKKISDSAIVFQLRGLPPKFVNELWDVNPADGATGDEIKKFERERDNNLVAKTIASVSNAAGAVDPRLWDAAQVEQLRGFLKEGEFGKLVKAVSEVNFNAMVFDNATDAGFSGRSTHLAG